jgi:hypothetical protein
MPIALPRRALFSVVALTAALSASPVSRAFAADPTTNLVVGFKAGTTSAAMAAVDHSQSLSALRRIDDLHAQVVTVPSSRAAAALSGLRNNPSVAYADVDGHVSPASTAVNPNDPYYQNGMNGQEWGETKDQANYAWGQTTGSNSVTIAVIDSGAMPTQADLLPVLVPGWNVLTNTSDTSDSYGHGTEVSGVAVSATNNGVGVSGYCWNCRLMPVEVYNSGSGATDSNLASGMTWAVDHGANVLSISLYGTTDNSVLDNAVSYALAHNVTVVAAAGNSGNSALEYPAAIAGVISVGATDQTDTLYSYSDYGSWVDVAAPGSQATTLPNGAYGSVGGTSIATPAVAGIVGLMLSMNPSATPSQIASALYSTGNPVQGANQVAHGRVNAANAVAAMAGGAPPASPPVNTAVPTISGRAQSGQTLTASSGTWSNAPTSYAYQWERCDSTGASCASVAGATASSYALTSADAGYAMVVSVTASNSSGAATAASATTAVVTYPQPPTNATLPTISGTVQSGHTLTASAGSWSGSPTSYSYQWQHCDSAGSNCANIAGATSATYSLASADVGFTIAVSVTATNEAGSASAGSAATAVVTAGAQTSTFSGSLGGSRTSSTFAVAVGTGSDQSSLSFSNKCTSLTLAIKSTSGTVVAQTTGPSVISLPSNLAAASYSWTVSGSCKTSYTLTVTSPSP